MAIRHDFETDQPYEKSGDIIIEREIKKYEIENPDYKFHKLEFIFDEIGGIDEIKLSFKHKDIRLYDKSK